MKAKKISTGQYRIYGISHGYGRQEVRYAKKGDALSYKNHKGGQLIWEDFGDRAEAQRYLDEKVGKVWW